MYLSRIDLHGFKSFADKTSVQFDPGITAIVGPNGCGKSNIIDAVRWVLGEQRARLLRSEKMENVIFNGTATRRALGLAEVSLTIHNTRGVLPTEYTDVTVTRRLYRSGDSEYLLNGTVCRLKDILDLFMDTGMGAGAYSVIELKMIEDILSESPQDRRRLFEEAAGITKYKLRRHQALRRLDTTQADLTRLADLTDEIEKRVRSLARQARKAQRHQDLQARLRALELGLAQHDIERLEGEQRTLRQRTATLGDTITERTTQLQQREAEAEAQRTALLDHERALSEHQRTLNAHIEQIRRAEAEARLAEERRTAAAAALERLAREQERDEARETELLAEAERLSTDIAQAEREVAQARETQQKHADARDQAQEEARARREALQHAQREAREAADAATAARARLEAQRNHRALLSQETERIEAARQATEQALQHLAEQATDATQAQAAARAEAEAAEAALQEAEAERARLDAALETVRPALREAQSRHSAAHAELQLLESLLEHYEGFDEAVQVLLEAPGWAKAPRTVADVLACPPEFRAAVDAALGPYAACLVVETRAEAEAGIVALRDRDAGRATFVVLDRLLERSHHVLSPTPRGTTPVASVVQTDARYDRLVRLLLQNTYLVESLDEAEGLRDQYPIATFVTPNGEWMSAHGLLRAGGPERTATVERMDRRAQREAAEAALAAAAADTERLEAEEAELREQRAALDVEARREAARTAARTLAAREREAAQAQAEREAQARRREEQQERLDALRAQLDALEATDALEAAVSDTAAALEAAQAARAAAEAAYDQAEAASRDALARYSEAHLLAVQAQNRLDGLRRERERAIAQQDEIARRERERQAEAERIRQTQTEAEARQQEHAARAAELREAKEELDETVRAAETAVLEARAAISDTETVVREVRRMREEAQSQHGAAEIRLKEIETRLQALQERVWDEYGVTPAELDAPEDFEPTAAREEIPGLREQLRGLGAVNELALESYEEEKQRLEFLREQQRDLEQAEASLRSTIREINATASARFGETFEAVRTQFQQLFRQLFGENATADLALAGDDPLEDDIEIRARPKGKKPSAITQLSGGEKTLTAIALLFAIYLVKPSPFCILDEVDAPLDDANVARFMGLIRSFSESTQFILVTHNKLTMEAADRMYGVTMQEEGVSKLVGVSFDEVLPEAA